MKGIRYQLKSVLRDKFCLMTFLLPVLIAAALHFIGSIDLSSLGEYHFGVLANDLSPQAVAWLERYGTVTVYGTPDELTDAIREPSTNTIGVCADGTGIRTAIAGDELAVFRQAAVTLPGLYEHRDERAEVRTLERPDLLKSLQNLFIPAVLIVAMFMGCTFNAMNIISEKEDGVALVNGILPLTPGQYLAQKIAVGFLCGSLSAAATACVCFRLSWQSAGLLLALTVQSSFVAALLGLLIGRFSDDLMAGVVCIKAVMLAFLAVPILYTLLELSGPLAVLCRLTPSQPAFEGILALYVGDLGAAAAAAGRLAIHAAVWLALCLLLFARCGRQASR